MEGKIIEPMRVLEQLCLFADCGAREAERWLTPAKVCAARLEARLRPGANVPENSETLALAAAGMLFYQYVSVQAAGDGDVKLGELSVGNRAAGVEHARRLRDELLAGAAPLLVPGGAFLIQTGKEAAPTPPDTDTEAGGA